MNRRIVLPVLFVLLAMGCAPTNKGKVAQLWDGYAGAVSIAADLRSDGVITKQQSDDYVKPLKTSARKAIAKADKAVVAGENPVSQGQLIDQAFTALSDFNDWLARARAKE